MNTPPPAAPGETPSEPSLIEYPSKFPIKVMGAKADGFREAMAHIALAFDPTFDTATIEERASGKGNYIGITLTITATSREQLDEMYRTLSSHPLVKVVL